LSLLTDRIDGDLLDRCPHVRVVSNLAVGFDNIDVPAATARGVLVGNTPGVLTETTADAAFALLMAAARRIPEGIAYVRAGQWRTWGPLLLLGHDVHHATLGLIGLGRIGAEVARRARGFAMRVLYTNRTRHEDLEHELGLEYVSFAELVSQADFVSVHTPLTPETRGLLGRDAFRQMKSTAIVINTARGPIIDTPALVEALQAGIIGGAALDVTDPEPLPPDHPLIQMPQCIVVPHIASASVQTRTAMAEIAAWNLLTGLKGERLPCGLNPDALGMGRQMQPRAYDL
ncbi:MAG TPA: D-glycerate dehydrogenase, partial [Ktedonobacterales bacterium]|nr:D-glycerate dehydrogenase [Ktedonobacterales bacterium]